VTDQIKRTILAAVGATIVAGDRVESLLNDLVAHRKLTRKEAEQFARKMRDGGMQELDHAAKKLKAMFEKLLHQDDLVTESELKRLMNRVKALESKVAEMAAIVASRGVEERGRIFSGR